MEGNAGQSWIPHWHASAACQLTLADALMTSRNVVQQIARASPCWACVLMPMVRQTRLHRLHFPRKPIHGLHELGLGPAGPSGEQAHPLGPRSEWGVS